MKSNFTGTLEFETIKLEAARDVLLYSFIVQKSVVHLDLSACEYSLHTRSTYTEEECRKKLGPRREILYRFHLDLPRNAETRIRTCIGPDLANQFGILSVSDCVYNREFALLIVNFIRNAEDKVEKLRRYFDVMKLLKLHQLKRMSVFLLDSFLKILYPDCADSEFVAKLALTFGIFVWIFFHENPSILGYVLHHLQRMRHNLWQIHQQTIDLINGCIIFGTAENIYKLLEYGTTLSFEFPLYLYVLHRRLVVRIWTNVIHRNFPRRRFFLLLQYLWVFGTSDDSTWQALCYIWRSIPDPYLKYNELYLAFDRLRSLNIKEMIDRYKEEIVEEDPTDNVVPRSLEHLCRVAIRSTLERNHQLPDGIDRLGMPPFLEAYLKLESLGCNKLPTMLINSL